MGGKRQYLRAGKIERLNLPLRRLLTKIDIVVTRTQAARYRAKLVCCIGKSCKLAKRIAICLLPTTEQRDNRDPPAIRGVSLQDRITKARKRI
jgi:hypothetical protein